MLVCTLIVHLLKSLESIDRDKGTHQHTRRERSIFEPYSDSIKNLKNRVKW